MNLTQLRAQLQQDPEFVAAEKELRPYLEVGDDIITLRIEHGWSQTALARLAGTDQANISRLESALANPTLGLLQKVANALGAELLVRLRRAEDLPECVTANTLTVSTEQVITVSEWPGLVSIEPEITQIKAERSSAVVTRME